jgi:hypothetical protein
MTNQTKSAVFDYRALRLLMGLIALALPLVVSILSSRPLSSISASYHTEARDAFVGMLFIVSSFLWAYNGHSAKEAWASKIASLAALFVAIFPTSCDFCESNIVSKIHYFAAAALFIILAYFCFFPFRKNTKSKKGKKGLRSKIYFVCGSIMIGCMFGMLVTKLVLSDKILKMLRITYWAEAIALGAFGFAWIVAGKYLRFLVDDEEALRLFRK